MRHFIIFISSVLVNVSILNVPQLLCTGNKGGTMIALIYKFMNEFCLLEYKHVNHIYHIKHGAGV